MVVNPHFEQNLLTWRDEYSGRYEHPPAGYYDQFDEKWSLFLQDRATRTGFGEGQGARTDDANVARLAYEWTGKIGTAHSRYIEGKVDPALIAGKFCIDAGCGSGRWTRVLQFLGAADVLSIDVSPASLTSVSRFNAHTLAADLTRLTDDHPELIGSFDFANLWGVAHHTHDPKLTFENVAATVRPGGAMYVMLYSVDGQHGTRETNDLRRAFAKASPEARRELVEAIAARAWNRNIPLIWNVKNQLRSALGSPKEHKIGVLDMLMPFYNWTVPEETVTGWFRAAGFGSVEFLNPGRHHSAARHYLAMGKS